MSRELVLVAISLVLLISERGPALQPPRRDASSHFDTTIRSVEDFHERIEESESLQNSTNPLEYTPLASVLIALLILAFFIAYKEKRHA